MAIPPHAPPGLFRRAVSAIAAATLLICLVGGLPLALILLAGNPLPADLPTWEGVWILLTSPDDGTLFLGVLTVVGWLAWAVFTASVLLEVVARLAHRPAPAIPGFAGPQRLVSALIAAVAALAVSPTLASSDAAPVDVPPISQVVTAVDGTTGYPATADLAHADRLTNGADQHATSGVDAEVVHLVERGEGLLDLQERYGVPWQRIAEANRGISQPDGGALQRGQARIYPGWQLRIPQQVTPATTGTEQIASEHKDYEVVKDDWMWHIADRYLGDPERFRDIAELNPEYADRHGDFPDHIEPGWTLRLPDDAVDSGPVAHARGEASVPASSPETPPPPAETPPPPAEIPPPPDNPEPPPTGAPEPAPSASAPVAPDRLLPESRSPADLPTPSWSPAPPHPAPPPQSAPPSQAAPSPLPAPEPSMAGGGGEDPQATAGPEPSAAPADDGASEDPERLAPTALASAGLLAALVLGAVVYQRRQRNRGHQPGTVPASVASRRLERTLRTAQQPLDTIRLTAALRALAAGLATHEGPWPDIAGVMITDGEVELVLYEPCPDPPEPWQVRDERWVLSADAALPAVHSPLAPLPALATVGSQTGRHILLDLERLGVLKLFGRSEHAADLLRYLAAELAHNSWSDTVDVLLAGFAPADAELLAELNPQRVRVLPSVADGVALLRRRVAAVRATLRHTGAADTLAGRVHALAGDAWMPQVMLVESPSAQDRAALAELEHDLATGDRCAVGVVTTVPPEEQPRGWRVTVNAEGVLHVRMPFLHTSLSMAALPAAELASLAGTMRQARVAPPEPVPPAPDPERWAVGTDAAGALRPDGGEQPSSDDRQPGGNASHARPYADPDLDDDLRDWYVEDPGRPRVSVLGEVRVDAHGVPPTSRRRLHAELIVYLAQRSARGADAALLNDALWPATGIADATLQKIISRARAWLGTDAGGNAWLTDVGADLAYRLAEGYLLDWHLFRRLRTRGELRGAAGLDDLQAALRLVHGAPLDGADLPPAPGTRNPYPWLPESDLNPDVLVAAVVDVSHQVAELCLATGDTEGVRWAVRQAWLADTVRSYDQPWRDLMRAAHIDGDLDQLRQLLSELMDARDAETPEELTHDTYQLVRSWLPDVAAPAAARTTGWTPIP